MFFATQKSLIGGKSMSTYREVSFCASGSPSVG